MVTMRSFCQHSSSSSHGVVVVGGGAAGLTAAFFAAREGAKVTVLERTSKSGTKILMSGGTRCNILPGSTDLNKDFFTSGSSSAMRAVFATWPLDDCRAWIEDEAEGLGLALNLEEETNKLFPLSNSSKSVRDSLVRACQKLGVQFRYDASVEGIERVGGKGPGGVDGTDLSSAADAAHVKPRWICRLKQGEKVECDSLVVATGGLSFPAVGTDGTGHRIMKGLGMELRETYPALTPLTGPHPSGNSLAGLSMYQTRISFQAPALPSASKAELKQPKSTPRTDFLFTHEGFSGPSVLDLSHHAIRWLNSSPPPSSLSSTSTTNSGPCLIVNWTNESSEVWTERLSAGGASFVSNILRKHGIRERLADALCEETGLVDRKASQMKGSERLALVTLLTRYPLKISGSEGFKKAEVTGGGVTLEALNLTTMEVKSLTGLHLCGEILDVFGRIGGFNFYWAWVSGRLAGIGAALKGDVTAVGKSLRQQKDVWVRWNQEEW